MKYAVAGPRGRIHRIRETANDRTVEITDEQAVEAQALLDAGEIPLMYDGRITTREAEYAAGSMLTWDEASNGFIAVPTPVPLRITAWQAKAALTLTPHPQGGTMLDAAEAAINGMADGAEKIVVLAAWNNNANFERQSLTILSFGAALGMDSDDLDTLFRRGNSLTV